MTDSDKPTASSRANSNSVLATPAHAVGARIMLLGFHCVHVCKLEWSLYCLLTWMTSFTPRDEIELNTEAKQDLSVQNPVCHVCF